MIYTTFGSEVEIVERIAADKVGIKRLSDGQRLIYPLHLLRADGGQRELSRALYCLKQYALEGLDHDQAK